MDLNTKVIVIGSGPAGLMAALTAAEQGACVTLLEALPSPGRKLLASGAGKCNFTNMLSAAEMADRFPPEQRRFVRPALLNFTPEMSRKFFAKNAVKYKLVDDFYCFPESEKASDILNTFLRKFKEYNVEVICNSTVQSLQVEFDRIVGVTAADKSYSCDYLIAAGGGSGFPALGGKCTLDKACAGSSIAVNPRLPALCGIKSSDSWVQDLAGIVLDNVTLTLDKNNSSHGTLLFTGDGISGPAALDMAGRAAKLISDRQKVILRIDFRPDCPREGWLQKLSAAREKNGKKLIHNILTGELPQALLHKIVTYAQVNEVTAARMSKSQLEKLLEALTCMPFTVSKVDSLEKAMATTGGISRNEINPRTMQSKKFNNLYFAGEFIDVDGPCGGYNIQWAFSSGYLAGQLKSSGKSNPEKQI